MQEKFKSPVSRLARLFQKGRDSWKEKALDRQKKVRALEIKVRDLSGSREHWKQRALAAESELKQQNLAAEREKQYRDDWIFIVDFTLELGKQKALVVLGVSQEYFLEKVISQRGLKLLNSHEDTLIQLMPDFEPSLIYPKIIEKLAWLADYEADLVYSNPMVTMTRSLETQLKQSGLNSQSLEYFQENQFEVVHTSLLDFQQQIFDYVRNQCDNILGQKTFLATSDVIESLFGKYKQFSARCPLKEMGQMLLTLCLSTMNLTTAVVKKALESISFADVEKWLAEVFGQSMLSKRKTLFSANIDDTETV